MNKQAYIQMTNGEEWHFSRGWRKQKHKGAITESRTLGINAKILSPFCHQHKLHNEGSLHKHRKLAGLQLTASIKKKCILMKNYWLELMFRMNFKIQIHFIQLYLQKFLQIYKYMYVWMYTHTVQEIKTDFQQPLNRMFSTLSLENISWSGNPRDMTSIVWNFIVPNPAFYFYIDAWILNFIIF